MGEVYYVPWVDGRNNLDDGVRLARAWAASLRLPLLLVADTQQSIPDELRKLPVETLRTGRRHGGPAVAVFMHPSVKLMARMSRGRDHAVVIEFPTDKLHGWAAAVGATNTDTGALQPSRFDSDTLEKLNYLEFEGNNGWSDRIGERNAMRTLRELDDSGALDEDAIIGFMLRSKSEHALEHLRKLIRKTKASVQPPLHSS